MNNSYELIRFARIGRMHRQKKNPATTPSSVKMTTNTKESAAFWPFRV
jgi:hypothetical protein